MLHNFRFTLTNRPTFARRVTNKRTPPLTTIYLYSLHPRPLRDALRAFPTRQRHLLKALAIPTHRDIAHQLFKCVKELCVHCPVPQITRTGLEAPGKGVRILRGVEAEDVGIWIGPVEAQILAETVTEFGVRRVVVVLEDEVIA